MGFGVWGLGFGVWGLGFGVWGLGFGVWGLGLRHSGFRASGSTVRLWGCEFRVLALDLRVCSLRFGQSQLRKYNLPADMATVMWGPLCPNMVDFSLGDIKSTSSCRQHASPSNYHPAFSKKPSSGEPYMPAWCLQMGASTNYLKCSPAAGIPETTKFSITKGHIRETEGHSQQTPRKTLGSFGP